MLSKGSLVMESLADWCDMAAVSAAPVKSHADVITVLRPSQASLLACAGFIVL